ncbi:MAG: hypothetical protein LUC34_00315, partial [Campylobacter sp.]|nr:hypothetical protein [Campylobacter sp.]
MYWEHEITDREFAELMLFIKEKEKDGVKVGVNCFGEDKDYDIAISSLNDFWAVKDEIRSWLKEKRAKIYKSEIIDVYQDKEWKMSIIHSYEPTR